MLLLAVLQLVYVIMWLSRKEKLTGRPDGAKPHGEITQMTAAGLSVFA
jgi:hypothetical protein